MTHTPGPWHWDSDPVKDDQPTGRVRYRVVAKGRTITQCYYPSGDGIAEADTRLIATAPDLLAALEWATKQIGILSQYVETPEALAKFDQCRAAIALAKGENHAV